MKTQMSELLLGIVLNAHLPFVKHPERDRILEDDWLFSGITETYLPMLGLFRRLEEAEVPFKLTLSVSPTLLAMLLDPFLQERYVRHLERLIRFADLEVERTGGEPRLNELARMYRGFFQDAYELYELQCRRNIVEPLKQLQQRGFLNIITTSATHAFLPLFEAYPDAVDAQILLAVQEHERIFGARPKGFWLPECGYFPGLEEMLKRRGIEYFFVDAHAICHAEERPRYGVYGPLACRNGVAAFGRDPQTSSMVWSAEEGYPGDISYRYFYGDIGFELPLSDIEWYMIDGSIRTSTGIKYRANADGGKALYDREAALTKTEEHAENFLYRCLNLQTVLQKHVDRRPMVVCPFDAELFGHWWFEGLVWLETVLRKCCTAEFPLRLSFPSDYLAAYPENQRATPCFSSWGSKGYSEVWLNGSNDWIYRHVHKATERMAQLVQMFPKTNGIRRRMLNQAARELLLMQASDWAFIMKTGTTVPYARRRTREHIHNFSRFYEALLANHVDMEWLARLERKNSVFPDMDYRVFSSSEPTTQASND